jgi:excisionase family DNA binding protein
MDPEDYLTATQAAERIGISRAAIHKAIGQGTLTAIDIAGRKFIPKTAAERYKCDREEVSKFSGTRQAEHATI